MIGQAVFSCWTWQVSVVLDQFGSVSEIWFSIEAVEAPLAVAKGTDVEDVDHQQVAGLGPFDAHRTRQKVHLGKVHIAHVLGAVVVVDLASGPVVTLDDEVVARLDHGGHGDVRMPVVVYLGVVVGGLVQIDLDKSIGHKAARTRGSLILSTVLTSIGANVVLCDQYMAIVMGARTYAEAYRERGLAPENLSRAVEDSATVTANLVPWNSGGAYQAATLGVATIAYLPFNFFCWLSPLVTVLYGYTGWTIKPLAAPEDDATPAAPDAKE